jgi:biopolymer transport protein TolQ
MYIIQGILHASIIVKLDILVLLMLSVLIWAAFFNKLNRLNIVKSYSLEFEKTFWSGVSLEDFYESNKDNLSHPLGIIFSGAMKEWTISQSSKNPHIIEQLKDGTRGRIMQSIDYSKIEINKILTKYQSLFLTVTSLAPLLGLFGTVCGIINTFHAIALDGNSNIAVVAPGVSEALITTAFSIIIAVISAVMYNFFNHKIENMEDKVDEFAIDLINILSRELDMLSINNSGGATSSGMGSGTQQSSKTTSSASSEKPKAKAAEPSFNDDI